jgi:hypothetical protein
VSPKLSILTSCYNDGATLLRSLRASLAQTEPDIEVIVVNNGSTDETALVMSTLIDPRVRTLTIPEGGSHPAAINRMMEIARAPWAMIVNADDWIEADYVAAVLDAAAQDDRINCVYAPLQCFGAFHHVIDFPPFAASACAEVHMVPGPRAFLSDLWHFMGGEDERWPIGADWDWVVRAAQLPRVTASHARAHARDGAPDEGRRVSAITEARWQEAQRVERVWWERTATEGMIDAGHHWLCGLLDIRDATVAGLSVTDLGCGPSPIVRRSDLSLSRRVCVDPLAAMFSASDEAELATCCAEDYRGEPTDEVWGYNVLQHVRDPLAVLAVARRTATRRIRWFEYLDTPEEVHHPHVVTLEMLGAALGMGGWYITRKTTGVHQPREHGPIAFAALVAER